jgi:MSHA biogenesis protein MshI
MKLALSNKIKALFSKSGSAVMAGIAVHPKFVRLVLGNVTGGIWEYSEHVEVDIESEEQWCSTLDSMISKYKLASANCCLILPGNRYQLLQIDKPALADDELAGALGWSIKDLVNIPQEDLIADFFHVPVKISMQGDKLNVIVSSSKTILPLIDVFIKNKIELSAIVPEEMVIRNIIGHQDTASLLLSQQKNEEIALQIVKKGEIYFARKLRGFNRIHEYTAEELVDGLTDSLSLEVQRSMDYFESQLKQAPIKNILLALPTEHQTLIAEQIAQHFMRIDVKTMEISNQAANVKSALGLTEQFFPALGGALENLALGETLNDE